MPTPTLRSLARDLGLSRTTVSEALRGSTRVNRETAERIRAAAEAAGYHHNPLAGAVMSEIRRSRGQSFRGVIAAVDVHEQDRPPHSLKFHRELLAGASQRAEALGFKIELFTAGREGITLQRLNTILQSRGIRGILLLPAWGDPDYSMLDWSRYAGVYTDYIIERPALHTICSDHYRSMMTALQRLHALGYKRPGLFVQKHHDERLQHRWEGAYLAFQRRTPGIEPIPALVSTDLTREAFIDWFMYHRPDVVLGHRSEVLAWMRAAGARVPATHGFFCLNVLMQDVPCAGLDLQPRLLGAQGIESVIAQLHRNEPGVPAHPSLTTISAHWVDGPTIRDVAAPAAQAGRKARGQ